MSVQPASVAPDQNPALGIAFILFGMLAISVNDMLIKALSGGYPLHQMVFFRSAVGLVISFGLVQLEGGWRILIPRRPLLQLLRGLLIVFANMVYFAALAVLPLGEATALFYVSPLLITLLSIPMLGEKVGPLRMGAVAAGFLGVLVMVRPWAGAGDGTVLVRLLPVFAALGYALMTILTRKLGAETKASALAVYIQVMFLLVGGLFWLIAGDGRFAEGVENESLVFLLRPWLWPATEDLWKFAVLGLNAGVIGYALSQAYRLADAGVIAPYEYVGLPLAVIWGWLIWGDLPDAAAWVGIALILGAGLFVFLRERALDRRTSRPARRA